MLRSSKLAARGAILLRNERGGRTLSLALQPGNRLAQGASLRSFAPIGTGLPMPTFVSLEAAPLDDRREFAALA
jgi:hypothetical protein